MSDPITTAVGLLWELALDAHHAPDEEALSKLVEDTATDIFKLLVTLAVTAEKGTAGQ